MDVISLFLQKIFANFGPVIILLGILIFIHELGHFLVAKFFKVRVEVFSLGFGKKILKFVRGETTYCLSLIPLGGYVKMYGDDPSAEVPEAEKKYAFLHKPVAQRIGIVIAGPLMNLFFAAFLFAVIAVVGEQVAAPILGDVETGTVAYEAGFRSGDKIVNINGKELKYWDDVKKAVETSAGKVLEFVVHGEAKDIRTVRAPVTLTENENIFSSDRQVGSVPGLQITAKAALVGVPSSDSIAARAGIQSNTIISEINGKKVEYFRQLGPMLAEAWPSNQLKLKVRSYGLEEAQTKERTVEVSDYLKQVPAVDANTALVKFGLEFGDTYLLGIKPKSPAARAGLKIGDKIVSVDKKTVSGFEDILNRVKAFQPNEGPLLFEIRREGQTQEVAIKPELTDQMNSKHQNESRYTIGIVPSIAHTMAEPMVRKYHGVGNILQHGLDETGAWTEMVIMSLVRLVQNEVSPRNIAGVITIGRVASSTYEMGLTPFLKIMAIISINLFLLNMLPIPILDGGHLVFFTIEALRGAPLSLRKMEIAQQVGMVLLMLVMVFALFNDITNLFDTSW